MSNDLLKMLHLIFLDLLKTEQKEAILLNDYGIALTRDMRKEIKNMGDLMEPAIKFAAMKAAEETKESERLSSIRKIMKNMSVSAKKAMDVLEIPVDEQSKYAALI